jgi:hypothetical protein
VNSESAREDDGPIERHINDGSRHVELQQASALGGVMVRLHAQLSKVRQNFRSARHGADSFRSMVRGRLPLHAGEDGWQTLAVRVPERIRPCAARFTV